MSHFTVGIIVPKEVFEAGQKTIENYIQDKMEEFDENLEVKPYIEYDKSKKDEYFNEKIQEYKDMINDPDYEKKYNIDHVEKQYAKYSKMDVDEYWKYLTEDYDKDSDGNVLSTYNPKSKWDWYVIGGRWDGVYKDNYQSSDNGFNFGNLHHTLENNSQTIKEYKERYKKDTDKYSMFAYIDKKGNWLERGNMGWWGIVTNELDSFNTIVENLLDIQDSEDYIINLDCHI